MVACFNFSKKQLRFSNSVVLCYIVSNRLNMNHLLIPKKSKSGLLLMLVLFLVITSCEKDKEQSTYNYFVSSQKLKTITASQAISIMNLVPTNDPGIQRIIDSAKYDVEVYKVIYKTTFKGSEINASGLICIPDASKSFPILSFQNGTNTLHADAPSQNLINLQYTLLQSMGSDGYIILMADYLGFGESEQILHPYYHRASSDAAVMDLINACDEFLSDAKVKALDDGTLYLMGYSQGGWATLSALAALEGNMGFTKDIIAASCGAGAYNVPAVAEYIFQLQVYPSPFYLPYFIESHIRDGFLNEPLQKYFNEPYASLIPDLFDGTKSGSTIDHYLNDTVTALITPDLINNFETGTDFQSLHTELSENSVEAWPTAVKLLFFHGKADDNVPSFESQHIYDDFLQKGVLPN